ncbi:MAG: hypothetical protein IMZ53_14015 [Thermoplasmata archaeon]|nr:hypothetical protein [Thermoplasmata archaeon]
MKNSFDKILLMILALIINCFELSSSSRNNTNAASPALNDVRVAISAAKPGDTVIVPEGTATWSDQLTISKGIILKGAGANKTIIKGNMSSDKYLVFYHPTSPALNEPFRISGFTLDGDFKCNLLHVEQKSIYASDQVRIDHNEFKNAAIRDVLIWGQIYGVADHNVIRHEHLPRNLSIQMVGSGQNTWTYHTFEFGSVNNFYWEDNEFNVIDSVAQIDDAGRYCFRYNTINYTHPTQIFYTLFDCHGNQLGQLFAGPGCEVYENTVVSPYVTGYFYGFRGGKSLVYNNYISTPNGVVYGNYREEYDDNLIPYVPNNVISGQPQHVSDSYVWGNTFDQGTTFDINVNGTLPYGNPPVATPSENIHYWRENASFNGSSGIGVGPLSVRPSSGLIVGVGYWATDTNALYRATSATVWEKYYSPYTYPHPLTTMLAD